MDKQDKSFWEELKRKFVSAWCPAFHGYFWGYIVFFALINIGFSFLFKENLDPKVIASSIATYFFGLIAASSIEINLSLSTENRASFSIYSGIFYTMGIILLLLTFRIPSFWSLLPAVLGFLISLAMWIIGNSDNPKLNDEAFRKAFEKSREKINTGADDLMKELEENGI